MSMVDRLSSFIVKTTLDDIPPETAKYVKELALKTTAGMLAGSKLSQGQRIVDYIQKRGDKPEARIIGTQIRTSLENAALVNGFFAHVSELEDDQYPGPTSDITIFPVIFPLCEKLKLSGKEFLEACAVGTEVMNRFSYYTQPRTAQLGVLVLSYYGIIGAATVAARAFRLDEERVKAALGLAFTQGGGYYVNLGTEAHYLDSAWSCRNGLVAAEMAREGWTSSPNLEQWLVNLLGADGVNLEGITHHLGRPPFLIHNIWIKKYPCCFLTQRQIDSLFMLLKEHKFKPVDVNEIILDVCAADAAACDRPFPDDVEASKFSYQHILSAVLLDGEIDMSTFTTAKLNDPAIKNYRTRIKVIPHPEWGGGTQAGIARVTVKLRDGKVLQKEMDQPPGGSKYPLPEEQLGALYQKYTRNILSDEKIIKTQELILNMEKLNDLSELIDILSFES